MKDVAAVPNNRKHLETGNWFTVAPSSIAERLTHSNEADGFAL
jgi:hypothetical protein